MQLSKDVLELNACLPHFSAIKYFEQAMLKYMDIILSIRENIAQ